MDWEDLRYVLAIARHGTLSAAAGSLGVSHTTVGRRLRALERRVAARLFDRTPDGLVATLAGQDLTGVAERIETEVLALESRVSGRDARLTGELRVATLDLALGCFPQVFGSFAERYPGIELTVLASDREVSLHRREADVALRLTDSPPPGLVGRRIGRMRFAVYAQRELADAIGPDSGYAAYPWLNWDKRLGATWLDDWLAVAAPGARTVMRLDVTTLSLRTAVAAGLGVHFLACIDGDADARLVRIGPVEQQFGRDLWLLTLDELRTNSRVRAFMDHAAEQLAGLADALGGTA